MGLNSVHQQEITFQDVIKITREIPGKILADYNAPTGADSEDIIIPRDMLLRFIQDGRYHYGDGKGKYLEFTECIPYQLQHIIDKFNITAEDEAFFSSFSIAIALSDLENNFELIVPFSHEYLSPNISAHISYIAKDYVNERKIPRAITQKFCYDEQEIIETINNNQNGYNTWSDIYNRVIKIMWRQSKEILEKKKRFLRTR